MHLLYSQACGWSRRAEGMRSSSAPTPGVDVRSDSRDMILWRSTLRLRLGLLPRELTISPDGEHRVVAAEAKGIANCQVNLFLTRFVRDVIQVTFRIGRF